MADCAADELASAPTPWALSEYNCRVLLDTNGNAAMAITGPLSRGELGRELSRVIANYVNEKYATTTDD